MDGGGICVWGRGKGWGLIGRKPGKGIRFEMEVNRLKRKKEAPNFLRNHQIDFQSGSTSFHFHQQWRSVPPLVH